MYLVRSGAISGFESLVQNFGANPVQLIHETGLSDALFRNPNSYISYAKMALLLEKCAVRCGAPLFGLLLAERNAPGVLGDLPTTISQEPTVGQALAELDRHIYLVANGVHIAQITHGKDVQLVMSFDFQTPLGLNQLTQLSVAHMANITSRLTGLDRYALKLNLVQPPPSGSTDTRSRYYPQTQFSSTFDGLILPAKVLQQKTSLDETAIQLHFQQQLNHLQACYPNSLQNQARVIIGQLLPSGECSIEKVAANLDLHPRMLQLKLQQEQTNYRDLLNKTRQTIAEQHLAQGSISITDLALNLGFAEVAVFSRSFKSWTGMSPKEWRAKHKSS
ncbi:MAG: AraC family transcriptional regulator ligand-binding domain-containing protein [Porticoccaceae bacterium]|nr:AraC family transcriptional regulator ligand-binding domain-containing protein [Pseudomonadales bacterium]MCP5171146.1 AraC family transcriptional regulator ligand-binding domain-containing protein [Pseudomonadales bacterium]MCP5301616.1 AraC family transcriptional regulator ligand-binding domain-containing protein [Pseudomonadales bacterium]